MLSLASMFQQGDMTGILVIAVLLTYMATSVMTTTHLQYVIKVVFWIICFQTF